MLCLLASIEPRFPVKVLQLDEMPDGSDIQGALLKLNSCMTVPQVYIGGKFIGGCTETTELHENKKLEPAIADAVAAYASGKSDAPAIPAATPEAAATEASLEDPDAAAIVGDDGASESCATATCDDDASESNATASEAVA